MGLGFEVTHYKALMKKNWINWKRTPCGSVTEILCPIALISLLLLFRTLLTAEAVPYEVMLDKAKYQIPLTAI